MGFSQMSSREKTIVAVLGVVILIALIGIGVLVARLVTGGEGDTEAPAITVIPTTAAGEAPPPESGTEPTAAAGATSASQEGQGTASQPAGGTGAEGAITAVPAPSLEGLDTSGPVPVSDQPVVVARQEGVGPGSPVIIADHPLHAGHRYRLEITAADGSQVAIQGSWGQAATSASGEVAAPQIEFFEGTTPFRVDIVAPVSDPVLWSCSASAGVTDLLGQPPGLVITIWDVTGVK
jgi:hypothetical protein